MIETGAWTHSPSSLTLTHTAAHALLTRFCERERRTAEGEECELKREHEGVG